MMPKIDNMEAGFKALTETMGSMACLGLVYLERNIVSALIV